jgi:uncharacterized membrane protein
MEELLDRAAGAIPADARKLLAGDDWLGHPLHPLLTDLPIGFWTSSWVLDIVGGRRARGVSTALVGFGVAAAAPTIAAGVVDFSQLDDQAKRHTGVQHSIANAIATLLYALSFVARVRGKHRRGIAIGLLGAMAVTVGGYLGGQLVFGKDEEEPAEEEAIIPAPLSRIPARSA